MTFEELDAELDRATMAACGEPISYTAANGVVSAILAIVDYSEGSADIGYATFTQQQIRVEVLRADVPDEPNGDCRLVLSKIAGKVFHPVKALRDESGNNWRFTVKTVKGA